LLTTTEMKGNDIKYAKKTLAQIGYLDEERFESGFGIRRRRNMLNLK